LISLDRSAVIYGQDLLVLNTLTAGQTYYLRVFADNYDPNDPVSFNICVNAPKPPANDACAGATVVVPSTVLDCSEQLTGTLFGATPSGTDCQAGSVNDVWYQFTAVSPSQRIAVWPGIHDAYGFELYRGDCDNLTSITCVTGDLLAKNLTGLAVGTTYYLRVFSPTYYAFDFQLCILTLPPPPLNDECAGALPLPVNPDLGYEFFVSGSTLSATSSLPSCGSSESTHDVWYAFVATSVSQRLLFNDDNIIFGDDTQLGYEVFRGNCGQLTSLACGHTAPDYLNETLLGGLTPPCRRLRPMQIVHTQNRLLRPPDPIAERPFLEAPLA
jgi:hypothetical protein